MIQRTLTQAKVRLSALVEAALAGEDVILSRKGRAVVKIVPVDSDSRTREPGGLMKLVMPPDFNLTNESIIREFAYEPA